MKRTLGISVILALVVAGAAFAKPVDDLNLKIELYDFDRSQSQGQNYGVFGAAQLDTTWFGGTTWNADSTRWEAIIDSIWTFDTGVGSHFDHSDPHVNPFKDPSLHAYMEGWIGIDYSYDAVDYFRALTDGTSGAQVPADWDSVCVGSSAGLEGNGSLHAGILDSEANALCYIGGQGYGHVFTVTVERTFAYDGQGNVAVSYDYGHETEADFDFAYFEVDTSGAGDFVTIAIYDGAGSGSENFVLTEFSSMRGDAGAYKLLFRFLSDLGYDDEDGGDDFDCPYTIDNLVVTDQAPGLGGTQTFLFNDNDIGGFTLASASTPGKGGDWSQVVHESLLPDPITECDCGHDDSVLAFFNPAIQGGGHALETNNVAVSPWIDLLADGQVGRPGKVFNMDFYTDMPLANYNFGWFLWQWYPEVCPVNGDFVTSGFGNDGFVIYFGPVPVCSVEGATTFLRDYSQVIPPGAEKLRGAVGIVNFCDVSFWVASCSGNTNTTPWFDNIRVGIYGSATAPAISVRTVDQPQDSFPQNGTLRLDAPGRVDGNNIIGTGAGSPEPFVSLGDTMIVSGGLPGGGANVGVEVRIQFSVDWGPKDAPDLADANDWLDDHATENTYYGLDWYSARLDSAQQINGGPGSGVWMTAYHEADPNFSGSDTDTDPNDPDIFGQSSRLANDIFPEGINTGLFTPGTRVNIFYKARYLDANGAATTGDWFITPDTAGGNFLETEVLPSSAESDETWNCVLYVDHFDLRGGGGQPVIEPALANIIPGTSGNFEETPWDRWDVRAPSSEQLSFGRPLNFQMGCTVVQALGYKAIIWDSGNLSAFNLTGEDANILAPWLELNDTGLGDNRFYGSGDGIGRSTALEVASDPSALAFFEQNLGASWLCDTVRDASCPGLPDNPAVSDTVSCIAVDPVLPAPAGHFDGNDGSFVANGASTVVLQFNGCPLRRSFDVLRPSTTAEGDAQGNEVYDSTPKGHVEFTSISHIVTGDSEYRTVIDGGAVSYRRDSACDALDPVEDRLERVLNWFGYGNTPVQTACDDPTGALDVPIVGDGGRSAYTTALGFMAPNPLTGAAQGRISFTMSKKGIASIDMFDVNGRLVRTLYDGVAAEGVNEVFWDGTDNKGLSVASGVYFYRLKADGKEFAKKMVVVRNGGN